jgi:hypothetical protein
MSLLTTIFFILLSRLAGLAPNKYVCNSVFSAPFTLHDDLSILEGVRRKEELAFTPLITDSRI